MCRTLSRCAERTFERLADGYLNGWAPGEESFTDFNLQDIRQQHGDRIAIRQFTRAQEARNGADWEWWFHDGHRGVGIRVQAKKAMRNGSFRFRYRPGDGQGPVQSLRLIADAANVGCLPFYVLYNHRNWVPYDDELAIADCQHSQADQRQLGCSLVSALVVQRVVDDPALPAHHARDLSVPWNRLVCVDPLRSPKSTALDEVGAQASSLHTGGTHFLRSIAEAVPQQRMERIDAQEGPEHTPITREDSPLYQRVAQLAEQPVQPLPERVIRMMQDDVWEPEDERLAGAVFVDVGGKVNNEEVQ